MGFSLRIALVVVLAACAPRAQALDVYFAGFAWLGDAATLDANYPYSRSLNERNGSGVAPLDAAVAGRLRGANFKSFTLKFDELGSLGPDSPSTLALAFVLDRETVSVETIGETRKIIVELSGQALFFDFRESAVVAAFPVVNQYRHVKDSAVTSDDIATIVRRMYFGNEGVGVLDDFVSTLQAANLNPNVTRRVQVTEVRYTPALGELLPAHFARDDRGFKNAVAQAFSKYLSSGQGIPVLPYSVGQAIGNRMAGRFSDGRVFDLKIPEPDYAISLDLRNLRKVEFERTPAVTTFVYGAYLHVRAAEPLSNTVFLDATLKNGASKVVPASQATVDDWPAYQEALLALMEKFSNALRKPDAAWASRHSDDANVLKQMKTLQKVLQSCR
ncbi:MAG TPA: hypothetical protein VF033_06795 [Steroidobacteraceae bacterium]